MSFGGVARSGAGASRDMDAPSLGFAPFMRQLAISCLLFIALAPGAPARAQEVAPSRSEIAPDSLAAVGHRDGRTAADKSGVAGRAAVAFAGGLPVGFFGLFVLSDQDVPQIGFTGIGLGLIAGAATYGSVSPPADQAEQAVARGPEYEQAFRSSYGERVQFRRRVVVLWGGAAGIAAGFGALLLLLPAT